VRADARGDTSAAVDLLDRAIALLPEDARRRRLSLLLGVRSYDAGDGSRAERVLAEAITDADRAGDQGASALASVGLLMVQASTRSTELSQTLGEAERLTAILERVGDEAGARLAQASTATLLFYSGRAGEATQRAKALVELGEGNEMWQREARMAMGASLVFGPTPAEAVITELQAQKERAHGSVWAKGADRGIGRMRLLQGRFDEAHELNAGVLASFQELGNRQQVASCLDFQGFIEHHRGNHAEGARMIREGYDALTAIGDKSFASTVAVGLGDTYLSLDQDDDAWRFATIARDTSSSDDVVSQAGGRAIQARVLSRRGELDEAESLAREAVAIMAQTDYIDQHGDAIVHLAHVLREAGKTAEAVAAAREALALYEQKGASHFVHRTQQLIDAWAT
jgi:tetratricopeptide (TPR) repeat protein